MNKTRVNFKWSFISVLTAGVILLTTLTGFAASAPAIPAPIVNTLADYSSYLQTGNTTNTPFYLSQMNALVADRRKFYQDFVNVALNLNLVGITSQYVTSSNITDDVQANTHYLEITEVVTLLTSSKISSPDEYPPIQAAEWALSNTSDLPTEKALQGYLQAMTDSVNSSLKGTPIEFDLRHKMVIDMNNNQATIVQDSYDDKSVDNVNGLDVINWTNNQFSRVEPDFTKWPDYYVFHTPISVMGKSLLDKYSQIASLASPQVAYSHSRGLQYINTWVKNTSNQVNCSGTPIYQQTANYNPSYEGIPCDDCANYVSQALYYGNIPQTSAWSPYNPDWVNAISLQNWLVNNNHLVFAGSISQLQPGDLWWTADNGHVAMETNVNPYEYSAHTNDRLNRVYVSDFTKFGLVY